MKRIGILLLALCSLMLGGCGRSELKATATFGSYETSEGIYYSAIGSMEALSGNYLVLQKNNLEIIDLNTKKVIKEIEAPNNYFMGFDINGTKVVWSAYNSKEEVGKDPYYDEKANTDIYLYDIATGLTTQITKNPAGQVKPKIWGNYIVWEDNRNDAAQDKDPEWDIYLYNISDNEEKLITTAPGIHTNPSISDDKVVWEDGRNFKGDKGLRWGENVPENNTDIYMYDIKTGTEKAIAKGKLQECSPTISGNYIAWEDRNTGDLAADIYLYDINKNEKIRITKDKFNQSAPKLYGKYLVWMDETNGIASNDVIINGKAPNSDIILYDIEADKKYLMTGKEPQVLPAISENYIAYVNSRQIDAEVQVIKYK